MDSSTTHRIRITLTSRNVRSLENVCRDLIQGAKTQKLQVKVRIVLSKITRGFHAFTWRNRALPALFLVTINATLTLPETSLFALSIKCECKLIFGQHFFDRKLIFSNQGGALLIYLIHLSRGQFACRQRPSASLPARHLVVKVQRHGIASR